ncbi:hypothetical protein HPB49_018222 [Dermacentor silvarum]|uniref:Uncharacterized protein n=1 Tax=Dermacentor silvarum TaxID=543639 RepID=A0ACB8CAQ4_DERSI|nr:hypothetical protein HPB49_018222 [Dermacentor silvarum]
MAQSPTHRLPGLLQQQRGGSLYPASSSSSSSGVSIIPGRKGGIKKQPSLQAACCPKSPPYQGAVAALRHLLVYSSNQHQHLAVPAVLAVAIHQFRFLLPEGKVWLSSKRQQPARSFTRTTITTAPISENPSAAPLSAVAVKRHIHAVVKVCPSESVRRPRHGGHRNERQPMALAPMLLYRFRCCQSGDTTTAFVKIIRLAVEILKLDPLQLPDLSLEVPMLGGITLHDGSLTGLSTVRRTGSNSSQLMIKGSKFRLTWERGN